jgi:cytochrome c oxidase subunit 2
MSHNLVDLPGSRRHRLRPSARTITLSVVSVIVVLILSVILWVIFAGSVDHLQTTFNPKSDNAIKIHDLYKLVWILAAIVMAAVLAITLAFSLIFRERPGGKAASHIHGNPKLEVVWTLIPVIIGILIVIPSLPVIADTTGDAPDGAIEIVATGHQWWFEFEYPDEGLVTANELHIPVGRPVNIELRSVDVIHSFWVPQLSGKVDMVPGHNNRLWFTPNEIGEYYGQCAEFCGTSHANMRFRVVVDSEADYASWVVAQTSDAQPAVGELEQAGEGIATTLCAACHTIQGTSAAGTLGPNLTHVGGRGLIASGMIDNDAEGLSEWLSDPAAMKPGSKMPNLNLSSEQIEQLVAYLQGLQ